MGRCQIKTGFFVLQDCGTMSNASCKECGKEVCQKHMLKTETGILCLECYAKQNRTIPGKKAAQQKNEELEIGNTRKYDQWFFRQREILFSGLNIEPFDESDFAAFNAESADEYFDETDAGGLYDS